MKKKIRLAIFLTLLIIAVIVLIFLVVAYIQPKGAGVEIQTNPESLVYINGEQLGKTPFKTVLPPEEISVKLVPESFEKPLVPYEVKVKLVSGVKTFVVRNFGELDELSSGSTISFEKGSDNQAEVVVVSQPQEAKVSIDGEIKGFSPYRESLVVNGDYELVVSAQGYQDYAVKVTPRQGYVLTVYVQLAKNPATEMIQGVTLENQEKPEEEIAKDKDEEGEEKNAVVEIKKTDVGFLRVRSEPSTNSEELARVLPGEKYTLIKEDEQTGWFKIEYKDGKFGWISNDYAQKTNE